MAVRDPGHAANSNAAPASCLKNRDRDIVAVVLAKRTLLSGIQSLAEVCFAPNLGEKIIKDQLFQRTDSNPNKAACKINS